MGLNTKAQAHNHAVARLSSNTLDLPVGGSASVAVGEESQTLIGS